VLWPDAAGVASGRPYRSVLTIKLGSGAYETANVTVQGGGTKSVTVLAGTYQATLVTMTMVMKVGSLVDLCHAQADPDRDQYRRA
jgi:hypothetical protein